MRKALGTIFLSVLFRAFFVVPDCTAAVVPFSRTVMDDALKTGLCDFSPNTNPPGGRPLNVKASKAMFLLAVASWYDPSYSTGSVTAGARLLSHVRQVIVPGKEPNADGAFEGWSHGTVALSLALVRRNATVWAQLSGSEQIRVELLLEALAISGHYCFDDGNNFSSSISGRWSVFSKEWNNNLGEGSFSGVVAGVVAFGPQELDKRHTGFVYEKFVARLDSVGFTQIKEHWSKGSSKLRQALGNTFTYGGIGLSETGRLMADRTTRTHPHTVSNGEGGKAAIVDGGSSPVLGQGGMVQEMNHQDGSGLRSDLLYAYETWMNALSNAVTVKLAGLWGTGSTQTNADARLTVGGKDIIYKMAQGYKSYSNGVTRIIKYNYNSASSGDTPDSKGYQYIKAVYEGVIANGATSSPVSASATFAVINDNSAGSLISSIREGAPTSMLNLQGRRTHDYAAPNYGAAAVLFGSKSMSSSARPYFR